MSGLDPNFTVLDRADAADLMDVIRHELGFSSKDKRFPRKDACLAIYSYRVNTRLSLKQTLEEQFPWVREWEQDLTRMYREYVAPQAEEQRAGLRRSAALLARDDEESGARAEPVRRISITCSSMNTRTRARCRARSSRRSSPTAAGVTVVGDDAQAIYSFRAAAVENILGFADRFKPKADMVVLVAELPLHAADSRRGQRAHGGGRAPAPQDAARHAPIHAEAASTSRWTMPRRRRNTSSTRFSRRARSAAR